MDFWKEHYDYDKTIIDKNKPLPKQDDLNGLTLIFSERPSNDNNNVVFRNVVYIVGTEIIFESISMSSSGLSLIFNFNDFGKSYNIFSQEFYTDTDLFLNPAAMSEEDTKKYTSFVSTHALLRDPRQKYNFIKDDNKVILSSSFMPFSQPNSLYIDFKDFDYDPYYKKNQNIQSGTEAKIHISINPNYTKIAINTLMDYMRENYKNHIVNNLKIQSANPAHWYYCKAGVKKTLLNDMDKLLDDYGITDYKSCRRYLLTNHPDKKGNNKVNIEEEQNKRMMILNRF